MIKIRKTSLLNSMILLAIISLVAALFIGCKGEEEQIMAQKGDTVKVHYTGTLEDGTQFDSSHGRQPLEFTIGEGKVIPGFENAVTGMKEGDSKTVSIPHTEAYGERNESMLIEISKEQLPADLKPEVGQQLQMQRMDGQTMIATVTSIGENGITVDANHPLAGKDLTFKIDLVEIKQP